MVGLPMNQRSTWCGSQRCAHQDETNPCHPSLQLPFSIDQMARAETPMWSKTQADSRLTILQTQLTPYLRHNLDLVNRRKHALPRCWTQLTEVPLWLLGTKQFTMNTYPSKSHWLIGFLPDETAMTCRLSNSAVINPLAIGSASSIWAYLAIDHAMPPPTLMRLRQSSRSRCMAAIPEISL